MKKLILASALLIFAFQTRAMSETTEANAVESHVATLLTSRPLHSGSTEQLSIETDRLYHNHTLLNQEKNERVPELKPTEGFANRYKSLFWYEGRKVYA